MKKMCVLALFNLILTLSACSHIADYLGKDEILLNMKFDAKIISRGFSGTTQEYIAIEWNVDMEETYFTGVEIYVSLEMNNEFAPMKIIAAYETREDNVLRYSSLSKLVGYVEIPVYREPSLTYPEVLYDSGKKFFIPSSGGKLFIRAGVNGRKKETDSNGHEYAGEEEFKGVTEAEMLDFNPR